MKNKLFLIALFFLLSATLFSQESVYYIKKTGNFQNSMINEWYVSYLKSHIKKAEEAKASLVIIELNTPGGWLSSAFNAKKLLLNSTTDICVFVNNNAISAGALIALSAKHIYMAEGGSIGAATPVIVSNAGATKASEKENSTMRANMRSVAEKYGRNPSVAEAMVDEDIVLTKEKDGIDLPKGKLLTLTTEEALKTKIINGKASGVKDILKALEMENASIIEGEMGMTESLLRFLRNPFILTLLIMGGIIGVFIEIKTPGFGIGGSIAIVAFSTYFIVQLLAGGANWMAPAIFSLGIFLIMIEIFVIPGFGVAGIMGLIAMFTGLLISFGFNRLEQGIAVLFFAFIGSVILIIILAKVLPKSNLLEKLTLIEEQTSSYTVSSSYDNLLGKEGIVVGTLRPAGIVTVDEERLDAVSEGAYIDKDTKVKVIKVEGNRIVVRKIEEKEVDKA